MNLATRKRLPPVRRLAGRLYSAWGRLVYRWMLRGAAGDPRWCGRAQGLARDPRVSVGKYTYGANPACFLVWGDYARVEIGSYCSIAPGTRFIIGQHPTSNVSTYALSAVLCGVVRHGPYKGPIRIGNDVWIGVGAAIMEGVTVGHGAVVGAGALVLHDVAPYAVVGGVPARVIRHRFQPDQIEALLQIAWWDWPVDRIRSSIDSFYGDIDDFIRRHRQPAASIIAVGPSFPPANRS